MVHDDNPLACSTGFVNLVGKPGDLLVARHGVPLLRVDGAGCPKLGEPTGGYVPIGMPFRRRKGADLVAIENDEPTPLPGEAVVSRCQTDAGGDIGQPIGCDGKIMIAEQEEIFVSQAVVDGEDVVEAL